MHSPPSLQTLSSQPFANIVSCQGFLAVSPAVCPFRLHDRSDNGPGRRNSRHLSHHKIDGQRPARLNCQTRSTTDRLLTVSEYYWTVAPEPNRPIGRDRRQVRIRSAHWQRHIKSLSAWRQPGTRSRPPRHPNFRRSYDTFVLTNTGEGASFSKTRTTLSFAAATSRNDSDGCLSEGATVYYRKVPCIVRSRDTMRYEYDCLSSMENVI